MKYLALVIFVLGNFSLLSASSSKGKRKVTKKNRTHRVTKKKSKSFRRKKSKNSAHNHKGDKAPKVQEEDLFTKLPDELVLMVFEFLQGKYGGDEKEQARQKAILNMVNRRWWALAQTPGLFADLAMIYLESPPKLDLLPIRKKSTILERKPITILKKQDLPRIAIGKLGVYQQKELLKYFPFLKRSDWEMVSDKLLVRLYRSLPNLRNKILEESVSKIVKDIENLDFQHPSRAVIASFYTYYAFLQFFYHPLESCTDLAAIFVDRGYIEDVNARKISDCEWIRGIDCQKSATGVALESNLASLLSILGDFARDLNTRSEFKKLVAREVYHNGDISKSWAINNDRKLDHPSRYQEVINQMLKKTVDGLKDSLTTEDRMTRSWNIANLVFLTWMTSPEASLQIRETYRHFYQRLEEEGDESKLAEDAVDILQWANHQKDYGSEGQALKNLLKGVGNIYKEGLEDVNEKELSSNPQ